MTPSEIFYKSLDGVIAQGALGQSKFGTPLYASPNDTGCAIGQLLPRAVAESWDQYEMPIGMIRNHVDLPDCIRDNFDMCQDMQQAHDNSLNMAAFSHMMEKVRVKYGIAERQTGA